MSRIESIRKLLDNSPDDTFLIYSLGMELLGAARANEALERFARVLELDSAYLAAYMQSAKAHQALGDKPAAIEALRRGIVEAVEAGDAHARDRMQLLLDGLTS